jgi:hypothetical protein
MPSLSPKDRVSLCLFSYEDGRRCRTPRISNHPHFCFYHAQKESQSQSTEKLAKEIAYFFSGDYLSANDLNTALGRLIPAVIRGQIKPRVARTVAYMLQTLMQSTRQAQHEYINAFSTDGWRDAISTSVKSNHNYLYPSDPATETVDSDDESEGEPENEFEDTPEPRQPTPTVPVGARPVYSACPEERREPRSARPASPNAPDRTNATQPQPTAPAQRACHPGRSEGPCLDPASSTTGETRLPSTPPPQPQRSVPLRNPFEVHFDHSQLRVDGKP